MKSKHFFSSSFLDAKKSCKIFIISFVSSLFICEPSFPAQQLMHWNLLNGVVSLSTSFDCGGFNIRDPELIGSGGGGSVFKVDIASLGPKIAAVMKVSWEKSTNSVLHECHTLQYLQQRGLTFGIENCVTSCSLPRSFNNVDDIPRSIIVMTPFLPSDNWVSLITNLNPSVAKIASSNLIRTMLDMLSRGVVSSDIQYLVNKTNGELYLIDFTEATILESCPENERSFLTSNFISEILNLIPSDYPTKAEIDQCINEVGKSGFVLSVESMELLNSFFL